MLLVSCRCFIYGDFWLQVLCQVVIIFLATGSAHFCAQHGPIDKPYRFFSVKTAYDEVRYRGSYPELQADCKPLLVYMVARHGSRFNVTADHHEFYLNTLRNEILANAHIVALSKEQTDSIEQWKMRMTPAKNMELSTSGWIELESLGRRLRKRFPSLQTVFANGQYDIRHTNEQTGGNRSRDSARAFIRGLWGKYENVTILENSYPDWLLQYYIFCKKYREETGDHPVVELENVLTGTEFLDLLASTAERLGLPYKYFDKESIYLLYETCRFEYGIYRDSPWCAVFTKRSLQLLEFIEDIRYYWMYGHAKEINYQQSCPLVKDLFHHISQTSTSPSPRVVARLGHSGTLQTFLARLGFFKDNSRLHSGGFDTQSKRKWRNSVRFPMGGNIIFIVTSCPVGGYMISAYINEQPVLIPGCDSMACPLDRILYLWSFAEDCDMNEICGG